MTDPTATYLQDLRDIRSTGANVKETSFYPALSNLLNEVGKTLKPKVRCVINLANRAAGLPDGGLFTPDQFQRASEADPLRVNCRRAARSRSRGPATNSTRSPRATRSAGTSKSTVRSSSQTIAISF